MTDLLQAHLQRTIALLQEMSEDGFAPSFVDYNSNAGRHGCIRLNTFAKYGLTYRQICEMAGLQNRPSGPRKGTKPRDPNLAPTEVEDEIQRMLVNRQNWKQALGEFPLQAIPTRTEVYHCTVGQTVYRVTREYASLR